MGKLILINYYTCRKLITLTGSVHMENKLDFQEKKLKTLFNSSSLSAIRVVSSAYPRLLIFLPAILIPVYVSISPKFLMMYSA